MEPIDRCIGYLVINAGTSFLNIWTTANPLRRLHRPVPVGCVSLARERHYMPLAADQPSIAENAVADKLIQQLHQLFFINLFRRLSHKSNSSRLKNLGAVLSVVFTKLIPIVQIAEASVLTGTSIDYPREDSAAHTTIASFWCQYSPSRFSL